MKILEPAKAGVQGNSEGRCLACGDAARRGLYCPDCGTEIALRARGRHFELAKLIFRVGAIIPNYRTARA